jgi:hypothetical protein
LRTFLKAWRNKMVTTIQSEAEQTEQRMSLYDLARTREFDSLSLKMQKFVLIYLRSLTPTGAADPLAAVKASYNCKSDQTARVLGFQLLGNPKIVLTLNRFFGVSPDAAFLAQVQKAIFNRKLTTAQINALELYSRIHGVEKTAVGLAASRASAKNHGHASTKDEPETATVTAPQFKVGDFCMQGETKFRITSVDSNGKPLAAEEVL